MEKYICDCGREFEKSQSLNAHYSHCKIRRAKFGQTPIDKFAGKRGWAKGFTKETNESVRKMSTTMSKNKTGKPGHKHTNETKENLSIKRTQYLQNSDNHSIWYEFNNGKKNIKVQGTWEKRFAEYLITNNINWDRFSIKYDNHRRYTPDFYLTNLNIYIEVKGWMKDRDIDKMHRFLKDNPSCDIRLVDSVKIFEQLENKELKIEDLEKFTDKYTRE